MATNKKNEDSMVPETEQKPVATLEETQSMIAKMLAEAKLAADQIVADAKASAQEVLDESRRIVEEAKKQANPNLDREKAKEADRLRGEELVEIKLFKDHEKYKDDVFVSCNGETIAIKRGIRVKVKRKFVEILDNSEIQDYETTQMIAAMDGKSEKLADL